MTQKEAVYNAVTSVLSEAGIEVPTGHSYSEFITKELRSQVNNILVEGFKSGSVELSKSFDDAGLKNYVSGLQSNWLRKDKRLNGGVAYVAKNPGTRTGGTDPQIKNLRALRSTLTEASDIAEVDAHIAARLAEIAASKKPAVKVDFSALSPELAAKFQK
jgi:hypothetical protein